MVPACFPDQEGNGPYRPSPVQYVPTIFDRVEEAGLSWTTYAGQGPDRIAKSSGYLWSVCTYFFECLGSERIAHFVPNKQLVADAENGSLPNFSLVTPTEAQSQHNNFSMAEGDNWIGKMVSAIQAGPQWSSTAIFITYDDCGCLYDHVNPLQYDPGWGIRVPLVIVSPYARPGYTDSTPTTLVSILAFAEHALGLTPLNASDGNAYDYANSFDYGQAPPPPVRMVNRPIPRWERRWLASHPASGDVT
jgi:phospholipase C